MTITNTKTQFPYLPVNMIKPKVKSLRPPVKSDGKLSKHENEAFS